MKFKITLIAISSALVGAAIATLITYIFYTAFIDEMLNGRYSTELAQDVAIYRLVQKDDRDKASRLLRTRMVGDLVGLRGQCSRLPPSQKTRAEELFQEVNELGIDAAAISGTTGMGTAQVGCP